MKLITYIVSLNYVTSVICLLLFLLHSGCGRVYFPFKLESVSRSERDAGQEKPKIELLPLTQSNAKKANYVEYTSLVRIKDASGLSSKLVPSSKAIIEKYPPYVDPGEYKIGENDIVKITFLNLGTLSEKSFDLMVSEDGSINLLNFGLIRASGLTLNELKDEIYNRIIMSANQQLKDFDLAIESFNSQKFFFNYKRMRYKSLPIYLKDLVSRWDDIGELAMINRDAEISIIRDNVTYKVSALNLFKRKGNVVRILPEDQIIIEPLNYFGEHVFLIGETGAQVKIPINSVKNSVLSDIVFSGDSLNSLSSDISQIYLLREKRKQEFVAYHLDITNPARAKLAEAIEMRPRDIVFVATQPLTLYNRILGQILTSVSMTSSVSAAATSLPSQ